MLLPGVHSNSLRVHPVMIVNFGWYQCIVENRNGRVLSEPAHVSQLATLPTFVLSPSNVTVRMGEACSLTAEGESAVFPPLCSSLSMRPRVIPSDLSLSLSVLYSQPCGGPRCVSALHRCMPLSPPSSIPLVLPLPSPCHRCAS